MGSNLCLYDSTHSEALNSASYFWNEPGFRKLGKRQTPSKKFYIGTFYRGKRSIITEEELWAAMVILRAYKRYRDRMDLAHSKMKWELY
ncbi:unnamed protein product [Blepharisma stoltei]|uniref:Uncharacterized protein n=1 Tax=Blepharisma stoltei TaxID=1481888 RepID=A0AAU9JS55_9CILI|nr:unnamed protein product [Blepharisma stoltei]